VKVRLEFANPELTLKPEMFADVEIRGDLGSALAVPDSAVITTGTRSLVFVALGEGRFEPRIVEIGARLPDAFEVRSGLKDGERVVTSANFLIDSESKMKAAISGMAGSGHAGHGGGS
jgi:Cu(I)/Ag(I) efflux system membrane fusion protein